MIEVDDNLVLESFGKLEDVMHHLKNNIKTKIGVSNIHGVGVFAITDIKEGEQVFPKWEWESGIYVIPNNRLKEIPTEVTVPDPTVLPGVFSHLVPLYISHSPTFTVSVFPTPKVRVPVVVHA